MQCVLLDSASKQQIDIMLNNFHMLHFGIKFILVASNVHKLILSNVVVLLQQQTKQFQKLKWMLKDSIMFNGGTSLKPNYSYQKCSLRNQMSL